VLAFAREYKDNAVIVAVGLRWAEKTNGGRVWPRGAFDAALDLDRYSFAHPHAQQSVAALFADFPATVSIANVRNPAHSKIPPKRDTAI
jgi:(1->4)-alpha-D-glucan 1-alpha-D-glucosylmutase